MKIFLGADHGGFYLKEKVQAYLSKRGYEWEDVGDKELNPVDDFPQFAQMAAIKVLGEDEKTDPRAILICKGGQGMAIAANRFRGIRAAVIWDKEEAHECRDDNDSNVLCLPARELTIRKADSLTMLWLETAFAGASRFKRRIKAVDQLG